MVHGSRITMQRPWPRLTSLCVQKLRNIQFSLCFVSLSGETSDSAQFARIGVQQPKLAATVRYFHVKQSGAALAPAPPSLPNCTGVLCIHFEYQNICGKGGEKRGQ